MPIYIFDLDLTISKKDTYIPFLLHCLKKNKKPIIHFPYLLLSVFFYYINFIDNTELKKRFLSAFLGGKKIGDFKYIINCFVDKILKDGLHNDAIIKINQILKEGHLIVLATASLDIYVNEIGRRLSFSKIFSTKVEINKFRKISGNLKGMNLYGVQKLNTIKQELRLHNGKNITFYTDSISDLPLIEWVEFPVIINPNYFLKRKLKKIKNITFENWS